MADIFDQLTLGADVLEEEEEEEDIFDTLLRERTSPTSPQLEGAGRLLKGAGQEALTQAVGTYGDILDLLGLQTKERLTPGHQALLEAESEGPDWLLPWLQDEDIMPRFTRLPSKEEAEELIGKTEPETRAERFAQRGARALGAGAAFGVSPAGLATLGAASIPGQTAVEMGAPEWVGSIVELLSALGPSAFSKNIVPKADQKKLVEFAKDRGLTNTELAGLLQGETKLSIFSKLAKKTGAAEKKIAAIEGKLGDVYGTVKEQAKGFSHIPGEVSSELAEDFRKVGMDLRKTLAPSPDKAAAAKFIEEATKNLSNRGTTPEELINFYQDINSAVNWNAIKGGKKQIAALKEPILKALRKTDPKLAENFELTNQLYSKFKTLSKALKPSNVDKFLRLGKFGHFAYSLATLNPTGLKVALGAEAAQRLSSQLLLNPRFQNITRKMLGALKGNNQAAASQVMRSFKNLVKKETPDIFDEIDWDALEL